MYKIQKKSICKKALMSSSKIIFSRQKRTDYRLKFGQNAIQKHSISAVKKRYFIAIWLKNSANQCMS